MNKVPYIFAVLGIIAVAIYSSIFIINPREQAIVLQFGEIRRVIQEPGAYFKWPVIENVQILDDRILELALDDIRVQVRDGRRYLVDAFIAYRIVNPRQFREVVSGSLDIANQNMGTRLDDVRIKRTDLLSEVSQRTFDRMKAERLAEAAELRALGTQEKLRIEAEADREATVTVAEAQRDADILRGEGEAQRNRIFAEAFQRDPDFFAFYRSMKAYETAIEGSGTTMVLSPDSQFFEYFKDSGGAADGSAAAGQ